MAFDGLFLNKRYRKAERVPGNFRCFADSFLWFIYCGQRFTCQDMHRAYPRWWMPEILCTDTGPLDVREP